MTTKLITDSFKLHAAKQFYESITEEANTIYYSFISKNDNIANNDLDTSISSYQYDTYNNMIFLKNIEPADISHMINHYQWVSGEYYDMYDDKNTELSSKKFYVVSHENDDVYTVFKCIYNNVKYLSDGTEIKTPSTHQPISTETSYDDEYYRTKDGYVWKYMYSLTSSEYSAFATSNKIPIKNYANTESVAIDGGIHHIHVENGGTNYNAYAFGSVKQASVSGNTKILSLQTDSNDSLLSLTLNSLSGTFSSSKNIFFKYANNDIWLDDSNTAVSSTVYYYSNNDLYHIQLLMNNEMNFKNTISSIFQTDTDVSNGTITFSSSLIDFRQSLIPNLSSNTDFYKNSSFYVRSGRGAGQLKNIVEYIVTGNERRILVDEEFETTLDTTSRFEIGPRIVITGDGTSSANTGEMKAVAVVDPSSNSISEVEVIDIGKGYTWAQATVLSNTGLVDTETLEPITANTAVIRPIISPVGGHGSNVMEELNAKSIGVSITITSTEDGKITNDNSYNVFGIIKNPLISEVELTLDDSALIFSDGDIVTQATSGASGEVFSRSSNTLIVKNVSGFFITGANLVSSDTLVESNINTINDTFKKCDQTKRLSIDLLDDGLLNGGFILNERVSQPDTDASGYVYYASNTLIKLIDVKGTWNSSDDPSGYMAEIIGDDSEAIGKITGINDPDVVKNSGNFLYVEQTESVDRNVSQTERLKIIIDF